MSEQIVYLKLKRNIEVTIDTVLLSDAASVQCSDKAVAARLKAMHVYHFKKDEPKRCVISIITIIEQMEEQCKNISVESLGETDIVVEWVSESKHKNFIQGIKTVLVALISFFGTSFTIMAYHNDIGINQVFTQLYSIVTGSEPQGLSVLEVFYTIGLGLGIILFFNHIGGYRITKDPTPIEVNMRQYEQDVDKAVVETAEREKKEK